MDSKILALIASITMILSGSLLIQNSNETKTSQFEQFKTKYGKAYESDAEHNYRLAVYISNMQEINEHNAKGATYTRAENKFTDLTKGEFKEMYLMKVAPEKSNAPELKETVASGSANWVDQGCVQEVKDQGQCGSCWAFSTVAVTESWQCVNKGILNSLSEQMLVSCDYSDGNAGCNGGWPFKALDFFARVGTCLEEKYPYTSGNGDSGKCDLSNCTNVYTISGHQSIKASVSALQSANDASPVSVCVDANNWSSYSSGIFSDCGTDVDHAVLLAGYSGNDYWLIKNSWGTWWGENGYIRLAGGANTCALADYAVIPTGGL